MGAGGAPGDLQRGDGLIRGMPGLPNVAQSSSLGSWGDGRAEAGRLGAGQLSEGCSGTVWGVEEFDPYVFHKYC